MTDTDTIAAISTPPGEGGVAVIRVSGPATYAIADRVYRGPGPAPSRRRPFTFGVGEAVDAGGLRLDEVMMLFQRAPRSYTREDLVEIQCHGGGRSARRILRAVVAAGARVAEPGEFTRRAFLNGRIDLVQAEAVLDLIRSRSDRAATAAAEQLAGRLSDRFNRLYDETVAVAADLEATLDFPDDELPDAVAAELRYRLQAVRASAIDLLATWDEGHRLRDGALVAISGRPNAGKSTLLNRLLGTDRAITSSTPGTTRDTIEEGLVLDGIPLRLVDTAGLRDTECAIEAEGIRRTETIMQNADCQIFMIDGSVPVSSEDRRLLARLDPARALVVLNKRDLGESVGPADVAPLASVGTSLADPGGIEPVRRALAERIEQGLDLSARPHAVIAERHRRLLERVRDDIDAAHAVLADPDGESLLAASHLRDALERIGEATGRVYHEELLASVFSRFCVGK